MFKAWLRQLPEQVFPQEIQNRVIQKCAKIEPQPTSTPQYLKDEISQLPPWNYYLLFAITCHISLLHNCSKDNKMTYGNLCVCFAPCLKIEQWIFQWLILDWKNCWQGCSTEREYLEKEYILLEEAKQQGGGEVESAVQAAPRPKPANTPKSNIRTVEESARSVSSSGHYGSAVSSSSTLVPSRDRPLQHFDKIPPPPAAPRDQQHQHQQRPSTAHATLAPNGHHDRNEQRSTESGLNVSNGRMTPPSSLEQDFLQRFPRPAVNNTSTDKTKTKETSSSPSRPVTSHIAHQQKPRDLSSDGEMPSLIDRKRSNTNPTTYPTIKKESPTPKKEKHRPPPMTSRSTPTRSPDLIGRDEDEDVDGESPQSMSTGGSVGLTAPELSPLKPLSPIGGL
jgi:hypothetical protein